MKVLGNLGKVAGSVLATATVAGTAVSPQSVEARGYHNSYNKPHNPCQVYNHIQKFAYDGHLYGRKVIYNPYNHQCVPQAGSWFYLRPTYNQHQQHYQYTVPHQYRPSH